MSEADFVDAYRRHFNTVVRRMQARHVPLMDAEDVAQKAWLVWRERDTTGHTQAQLLTAVTIKAWWLWLDIRRRPAAAASSIEELLDSQHPTLDPRPGRWQTAVAALPKRQRTALRLVAASFTTQEIAQAMNVSQSMVKVWLAAARKQLAK